MLRALLMAVVALTAVIRVAAAQTAMQGKDGNPVSGFDLRLYSELARGGGNVFVAPASISSALDMTMAGARGATAKEMADVLGVPDAAAAAAQYRNLQKQIDALQNSGAIQLSIANSLWAQEGIGFDGAFLQQLGRDFGSDLLKADYRGNSEAARQKINQWVSEKTQQRITDLIARGAVRPDTQLILVNAIYLKALWEQPFEPQKTDDGEFATVGGRSVRARMMHNEISAMYSEDAQAQMLELPYRGGSVTMVILLPKRQDGLKQLEESLPGKLMTLRDVPMSRRVSLALPRFTMRYQTDLAQPLAKMGMPSAFSDHADFTGMRKEGGLLISKVVHEAFVDVDEQGTEAAGATGVMMRPTAMRAIEQPVQFVADHPFVFAIVEKETNGVLFIGRLIDPSAK